MTIEYLNGVRVTPLLHEMSPLNAAIERYTDMAQNHFNTENSLIDKSLTKQEREAQLVKALSHLENERRLAETIVSVQAQLEEYRKFGRSTHAPNLSAEKHHPTAILAKFMRAANKPQPSSRHTAHHVVPGKGKTNAAGQARLRLHRYSIRINDPDNGVWLPRCTSDTPHWSMPNAKGHTTVHTKVYENWVLQSLRSKSTESTLRLQLNILGKMLQHGTQPKNVVAPDYDSGNT